MHDKGVGFIVFL